MTTSSPTRWTTPGGRTILRRCSAGSSDGCSREPGILRVISAPVSDLPHDQLARPLTAAMPQLLHPKAIAVVGASQRGGRGANVIANLQDCGFAGDIFAVNPRYAEILGRRCFPSVGELPA